MTINSRAYAATRRQQLAAQRVYDHMEPNEDDDDEADDDGDDTCLRCPHQRRGCSDDCEAY